MSTKALRKPLSRRRFFKLAGGATVAAAGMGMLPRPFRKLLGPVAMSEAMRDRRPPDLFFAGTDGWIFLPPEPPLIPPRWAASRRIRMTWRPNRSTPTSSASATSPDSTATQIANQKNKAQHSAPLFWVDQYNPAVPRIS